MGWGWGKGFMSHWRGGGTHEELALGGLPPLDPSTPLSPRRIYDTVGGPSQGMDSGSGAGMTGETGVGWG